MSCNCKCKETRLMSDDFNDAQYELPTIKIVTDNPNQFQKAYSTDGGYDILASRAGIIRANDTLLVSTNLKVSIPKGYVGLLKSRSGLATKHRIEHGAGVIDCGYTGEVKVLLQNHSTKDYHVNVDDKVAQMVILPICRFPVQLVGSLDDSARGGKGFNSSGYK